MPILEQCCSTQAVGEILLITYFQAVATDYSLFLSIIPCPIPCQLFYSLLLLHFDFPPEITEVLKSIHKCCLFFLMMKNSNKMKNANNANLEKEKSY